ncbi:ATP-binding cassette transporter, partial [Clonorchis sinensis]
VRKTRTPRLAIEKLVDPEVKRNYQNQLLECLPDGTVSDINGHRENASKVLLIAGTSIYGTNQPTSSKSWTSNMTVSLLQARRPIIPGRNYTRCIIRRQVKLSVRADREAWWTRKAQEMEDVKNAGNVRKLFHLIRSTGPRKPLVSEIIRDQNGSLISSKGERLQRWNLKRTKQLVNRLEITDGGRTDADLDSGAIN